MVPEYVRYHGCVFAEILRTSARPILISRQDEDGRLSSYAIDETVGLHIKHSSNRLHPWQFTFTPANISEIRSIQEKFVKIYIVLVCHTDGILSLPLDDVITLTNFQNLDLAWLRVDRQKRQRPEISGNSGGKIKRPYGVENIIDALSPQRENLCSTYD